MTDKKFEEALQLVATIVESWTSLEADEPAGDGDGHNPRTTNTNDASYQFGSGMRLQWYLNPLDSE